MSEVQRVCGINAYTNECRAFRRNDVAAEIAGD